MILSLLGLGSVGRIIASLLEFLSPVLQAIWSFLVLYAKILWSGAKDIFDSLNTVITVLSLCALVYVYTASYQKETYIQTQCTPAKKVKKDDDRWKDIFKPG